MRERHFMTGALVYDYSEKDLVFPDGRKVIHPSQLYDSWSKMNKRIGMCQGWTRKQYDEWKKTKGESDGRS